MASIERDVEAATPMYAPQASPKTDALRQECPASPGASTQRLLLASMPRMAIQMAWTAALLAMGPIRTTRFADQFISVIVPLTTLLLSPVIGVISDNCTHQWGRRRPFLVFTSLAFALVLFIMCFTRDLGELFDGSRFSRTGTSFFAVIFYLCVAVAVLLVEMPVNLLIADLAGDRQITGAALGQGWSILGSIFVVSYVEIFPDSSSGVFVAVCIGCILAITAAVVYNVQEPPRESSEATHSSFNAVFATIVGDLNPLPTMLAVFGVISVLIAFGEANYSSSRLIFFETRVVSDSDDDYYYRYSSDSSLGDFKYFMIQNVCAYIFTWMLPYLTSKIGANHVLTISLVPQALLIIMAFLQSKTLVGLIDYFVTVFRGTIYVLVVPAVVHAYGKSSSIGGAVGVFTGIGNLASLLLVFIGDSIAESDLGSQLPVLLGGIMGAIGVLISVFLLQLKLKSL